MKELRFKVGDFLPVLSQVASVVSTKNVIPALANVLIEVKDDGNSGVVAVLTASDSETWLSKKAVLEMGNAGDKLCIGATDICGALRNLDGESIVNMVVDDERMSATFNYGNGHFVLPYFRADEYPVPSNTGDVVDTVKFISGEKIMGAIGAVDYAVGNDVIRPIMNGIHFDFFNDRMVTVATDSIKLARYVDTEVMDSDAENESSFNLPKKPAVILSNIISDAQSETLKVVFNNRSITFSNRNFLLTTRLIEGRYPPYDMVIPKMYEVCAKVNKETIVNALKRTLPMSSVKNELIALHFTQGQLTLNAEDIDYSRSSSETIECIYDSDNELTIGFNGSLLVEMLKNIPDDSIVIELTDAKHAAVFHGDGNTARDEYLALLLPITI